MKKYLALILSLIMIGTMFAGCAKDSSVEIEEPTDQVVVKDEASDDEKTTVGTVYLNSSRKGAITKAASPVIGISFDDQEEYYEITKTESNFMIKPVSGNSEPFYVMFDSPDEVVIGDFAYGFATAISTKVEDLIHIYDFEKNVVYKVVTPLHTNKIKKINEKKYAVQYVNDEGKAKTISFSTDEKYAYDLFINTKNVVMIVDGDEKYDVAKELAGESEGATTLIEDGTTVIKATTTANNTLKIVTETVKEEAEPADTEDQPTETETITAVADEETTGLSAVEEDGEETVTDESTDAVETPDEQSDAEETTEEIIVVGDDLEDVINDATTADEETEAVEAETVADETTVVDEAAADDVTEAPSETLAEEVPSDTETSVTEETYYIVNEEEMAPAEETVAAESRHKDIDGGLIIDVPLIGQFPYYPTGCESVSATMALRYSGFNITVDDFINNYLDKSNDFYIKDGLRYGPSPAEYFIGSPYDASGFGCHANVIYNAFMKIYGDPSKVLNTTGISMEELCRDYVSRDIPVLVWVNISMNDAYDSNTWNLADGTEFTWKSGEHCMVLVGYDANNYYFNDPYTGKVVDYSKAQSEECYSQQGMQSVVINN